MARWGMVIDLDRCTGCQACAIACQHENNIPFSTPEAVEADHHTTWIKLIGTELSGRRLTTPLPLLCQHCDSPPCTRACPATATYSTPEGIVAQIFPACIGCRYCMNACPYGVRVFNWTTPEWPEEMVPMANPDVSRRTKGVVEKCTFCHHRLIEARERARVENRELAHGDYVPACVQTCPAEAMTFGDLENPDSTVAVLARSNRAFRLMEDMGTHPKVVYLRQRD